jgi:hypothetical protein
LCIVSDSDDGAMEKKREEWEQRRGEEVIDTHLNLSCRV